MFRFEYSIFLYGVALLPILVLFYYWAQQYREKALKRLGNTRTIARLMPGASPIVHRNKFILLGIAVLLLIIGLANPQWGTKTKKVKRKGIDLIIAVDVSQSMMAEDIKPNRLLRVKKFAQDFLKKTRGNNVGLILFACNAYLQVPLTTDYANVMANIKAANPGSVPSQGTTIGQAINVGSRAFKENEENHRAIVVLSDGEDHDGEAVGAAKEANDKGVLIYTVGVGSAEGSLVPVTDRGRRDYKRDETGNPIRSQLNEEMLKEIARAGDGAYFNLSAGANQVANALQKQIDNIEKKEFEQRVFDEYASYFQWFIGLGLVLILIEFLLPYRRKSSGKLQKQEG